MLPALDTVSADLNIPLRWQALDTESEWQQAQQDAMLMLNAMTGGDSTDSNQPAGWQHIEAKLDLLLNFTLQSRFPAPAQMTACRIGLEAVAWLADTRLAAGSRGVLQLHLHGAIPVLRLPASILSCQATSAQFICVARLHTWQDDSSLQSWEKWVFRQHRQQLSANRKPS